MNEMRKLIETIDRIDEEISEDELLRELRSGLIDVSRKAAQIDYIFSEMPDTEDSRKLAQEVERECDRLRRLIHNKL